MCSSKISMIKETSTKRGQQQKFLQAKIFKVEIKKMIK